MTDDMSRRLRVVDPGRLGHHLQMTTRHRSSLLRALVLSLSVAAAPGCPQVTDSQPTPDDTGEPTPWEEDDGAFSGSFEEPNRDHLWNTALPPGPDGTGFLMIESSEGSLVFHPDRRQPISAAAGCAALVLACYEPGVRGFLGCLENVRTCPDDTPWDDDTPLFCCAEACADRHRELTAAGADPPDAAVNAILSSPSCMPGVEAYLEDPS
jgi:hypothetical protein